MQSGKLYKFICDGQHYQGLIIGEYSSTPPYVLMHGLCNEKDLTGDEFEALLSYKENSPDAEIKFSGELEFGEDAAAYYVPAKVRHWFLEKGLIDPSSIAEIE